MKSRNNGVERFCKSYPIFCPPVKKRRLQIRRLFSFYHPVDFQKQVSRWLIYALGNNQSAYDDGGAREDLLDFILDLDRLIEAYGQLFTKEAASSKFPVTEREKQDPMQIIHQFRKNYSYSYAQTELLDLLEAVLSYNGYRKSYKGDIALFYQHLVFMLQQTYTRF